LWVEKKKVHTRMRWSMKEGRGYHTRLTIFRRVGDLRRKGGGGVEGRKGEKEAETKKRDKSLLRQIRGLVPRHPWTDLRKGILPPGNGEKEGPKGKSKGPSKVKGGENGQIFWPEGRSLALKKEPPDVVEGREEKTRGKGPMRSDHYASRLRMREREAKNQV